MIALMILTMQVVLIYTVFRSQINIQPDPDFILRKELRATQAICSLMLHLILVKDVERALEKIRFLYKQEHKFDETRIPYIIACIDFLIPIGVQTVCMIVIAN